MKKKNFLVSIIIPVYNVEEYINRCIDSVVGQTYNNLEIILVDDGTKDNSGIICDNRAKEDKRIKVIHKENGGLGSARNSGIKNATGEYLLFLDSDDYIEKNTVEKMLKEAKKGYDIVCCGFDRVDEETKVVFSKEMITMPFDELEITEKNIMETAFLNPSGWGKLFKKDIIKNVWFSEDKRAIEDTLFYLEIIPKTKKIKYIKEILWHYMVRPGSLILSITEEKANLFEENLLEIKNIYEKNKYCEKYMDYLTLQVFIHNCVSIPSRIYNNKDIDIGKRIVHIKKYMDNNFPKWRKVKIKAKGRFVKKCGLNVTRLMYKTNTFKLFLIMYNFMINKLKIDIKW
ncbi:MAG: glycosyltransferase family 2 protein [Clostridia bacterium]|nr:glycosyltransferase family 2 protein [Clostridia bacterium]